MLRILAIALLAKTSAVCASAQALPDSVGEPYRVFAAEMKKPDPSRTVLQRSSYQAWKAAEEALGDSKATGDLAVNFAESRAYTINGKRVEKDRERAYRRAIELSRSWGDRAALTEAERTILWLDYRVGHTVNNGGFGKVGAELKTFDRRLAEFGLAESTFAADSLTLQANLRLLQKRNRDAVEIADAAIAAYEAATDGYLSSYRYQAPLYKAVALERSGEKIEAALQMQSLIDDHHAVFGIYTGPSITAYSQWLDLRDELLDKDGDDQRLREIAGWTPPPAEGGGDTLRRVPPVMPPVADKSGWAHVRLDVTPLGRTENIRVVETTGNAFRSAASGAVKAWIYPPGMPAEARKDVENIVSFRLTSTGGRLIPPPRPAPKIPAPKIEKD